MASSPRGLVHLQSHHRDIIAMILMLCPLVAVWNVRGRGGAFVDIGQACLELRCSCLDSLNTSNEVQK